MILSLQLHPNPRERGEMEVVVPVHDFQFDSSTSTPYVSAPSSPKRLVGDPFNYYYHYTSVPASPTRAAAIYAHFSPSANNTRRWDESGPMIEAYNDNFEFDFSGQLEKGGLPPEPTAADELFEKGRIRPLKPPPHLHYDTSNTTTSSRSPRRMWSPHHKSGGEEVDPFTVAIMEVTRDRGRDRNPISYSSISTKSRKGSRSLSPLRGEGGEVPPSPTPSTASTSSSVPLKKGGSKKWRLRDLLLFRSASEGRATGNRNKDPLRKYTMLPSFSPSSSLLLPSSPNKRVIETDSRNSSFRSTDSNGSMRRRSGVAVSAHEIHYTTNRAASEESKKKTPLAYRQGLFGCLRYNPAINSIAKGISNSSFNRRS